MWSGFTFKTMNVNDQHVTKPIKRDFISHPALYGMEN
jgi:hypothetical protein